MKKEIKFLVLLQVCGLFAASLTYVITLFSGETMPLFIFPAMSIIMLFVGAFAILASWWMNK